MKGSMMACSVHGANPTLVYWQIVGDLPSNARSVCAACLFDMLNRDLPSLNEGVLMKAKWFKFEMGSAVVTTLSKERGVVVARCDYDKSESTYRIRYVAADGRQTESWFQESELRKAVAEK